MSNPQHLKIVDLRPIHPQNTVIANYAPNPRKKIKWKQEFLCLQHCSMRMYTCQKHMFVYSLDISCLY